MSSSWFVGDKADLGENLGGIAGPQGKDSYPNEIKQGWQFDDNGAWKDASFPNDVIFKVIGTFIKLSLYEIYSALLCAMDSILI